MMEAPSKLPPPIDHVFPQLVGLLVIFPSIVLPSSTSDVVVVLASSSTTVLAILIILSQKVQKWKMTSLLSCELRHWLALVEFIVSWTGLWVNVLCLAYRKHCTSTDLVFRLQLWNCLPAANWRQDQGGGKHRFDLTCPPSGALKDWTDWHSKKSRACLPRQQVHYSQARLFQKGYLRIFDNWPSSLAQTAQRVRKGIN